MSVTAIVQARMNSSRLPGKVALPLNDVPTIQHVTRRALEADSVDSVVVATSYWSRDDLVAELAQDAGADVYRGSEDDVLGRVAAAARHSGADTVARITGDNPFVDVNLVDAVINTVVDGRADYASNKIERTFPLGVDAEAFTLDSLKRIDREATLPKYREHVTPFYHDHEEQFTLQNITVEQVHGTSDAFPAGPELRMTMDEPADYRVYDKVYNYLDYDTTVDARAAARYIVKNGLDKTNDDVEQKFR